MDLVVFSLYMSVYGTHNIRRKGLHHRPNSDASYFQKMDCDWVGGLMKIHFYQDSFSCVDACRDICKLLVLNFICFKPFNRLMHHFVRSIKTVLYEIFQIP
jgi:hypothetical protein